MNAKLALLAEGLGTAALLAIVVGSGHMGEQLAQGNAAVALLANSLATGAGLYVLITLLAPVSGAHFNPVVSATMCWRGELSLRKAAGYIVTQFIGAIIGVVIAHAMFDLPLLQAGTHARSGAGQWLSEIVATAGLLATILLAQRARSTQIPALVGSYITAAYWFTASTSFANPAVTLARALTDTFAGIRPADVAGFIAAQCIGAIIVIATSRALALRDRRANAMAVEATSSAGKPS
ncbi:MAG: aquaporin family protein [Gammaproteobacteria bacterium]|nr:MAG: aquaporin family protein [Gammaproteobacteria bacterium]